MFSNPSPDPVTPDVTAIIDRVRRTAVAEYDGGTFPDLERCISDVVTSLIPGTVVGFVPLLAIRHVGCCIQAGTCDCGDC